MSTVDENTNKVEKALGEPVFIGFSDELMKMRRNLVVLAFLVISYKLSNAQIEDFSPLGIKFKKYDPAFTDEAFFWFLLYSFIHFFWNSLDALMEWRIRVTGTRLAFVTVGISSSEHGDYPNDPRQSSLLTWWSDQAHRIGSFKGVFDKIDAAVKDLDACSKNPNFADWQNMNNITQASSRLQSELASLTRKMEYTTDALNSARIPISLSRFEKWFKLFSISQYMRWIILEWGLPVLASLVGLWMVFPWKETIFVLLGKF